MYTQGKNSGLGELNFDIGSIISDLGKAWAGVEQAKAARDVVKYQAQQSALPALYAQNPQYSGTYSSSLGGSSMGTIILLGGAAFVLYLALRKD